MEVASTVSYVVPQMPQQAPQQAPQARSEPLPSERPREPNAPRGAAAPPPPEARSDAARAEGAQPAQRSEAPRPVINERGQKTGTIVDTTA